MDESTFIDRSLKAIEEWCNAVLITKTTFEQSDEVFSSQTVKFKALRGVIEAYDLDAQSELVAKVQSLLMQVYGGLKDASLSK